MVLETIDPLKSKFFLERRELGVINIGGEGIVTVDGKEYTLKFKDALYVGRGKQKVTFKSKDSSNPAKFYINSATAHKEYKTQLITIDGRKGSLKANSFPAGKLEESNDRVINQLIVNNVLEEGPCQLQMGLTELKPGSVWNTMPAHTHSRRIEAYFYFNVPTGNSICPWQNLAFFKNQKLDFELTTYPINHNPNRFGRFPVRPRDLRRHPRSVHRNRRYRRTNQPQRRAERTLLR